MKQDVWTQDSQEEAGRSSQEELLGFKEQLVVCSGERRRQMKTWTVSVTLGLIQEKKESKVH